MGHNHLEGSPLNSEDEDRGGLLIVLACGAFRPVVVVDAWLLDLLLEGEEDAACLSDLAGVVLPGGFAADFLYRRGAFNLNSC